MDYRVLIYPRAQRDLEELPEEMYKRVLGAIIALAQNPRPPGCTKLRGREGWRIRQGDYRVIYMIDDQAKSVTIVHIGHRREIYR